MKKINLTQINLTNVQIFSWLPSQNNDEYYPLKDVTLITTDDQGTVERGYHKTSMKMTKQDIIERNLEVHNITEKDRVLIELMSMRSK